MHIITGAHCKIRACRSEDIDEILSIEKRCFPDPYDKTTFLQLIRMEPFGFLVAESDGKVVGYVAAVVSRRRGMIYSIAVDISYRRLSIGRDLMKAELAYLSKVGHAVYLQVDTNNASAIALYRSLAFTEISRISRYYKNGADAILMKLEMKD
jgi:[ribosomal protein S18]-alanine N-acetyltransferase